MAHSLEDLSALSRRRALSAPESRRLEVYLKSSEDARVLHEIGNDYDRMPAWRADDAALLRRVTEAACERFGRPRPARRGAGRVLLGVAIGVLATTVAAASVWTVRAVKREPSTPAPSARPAAVALKPPAPSGARTADVEREVEQPELGAEMKTAPLPDPDGAAPKPRHDRAPARAEPPPEATEPEDAAALFSRANAQRKAGDVAGALALYAELGRRFPGSAEARLSRLLAGRLLLRAGDAAGALGQFDRYLREQPRGALAEEALHGKAQALRALGRRSEETATWRRLLESYPRSVHARSAREHLATAP